MEVDKEIETKEQYDHVRQLILDDITETHGNPWILGNGQFRTKSAIYCMEEHVIATVKTQYNDESKRLVGGIMKSGRKVKKRIKSEVGAREKIIPSYKKENKC